MLKRNLVERLRNRVQIKPDMFKKLRNRFLLWNMLITTFVMLLSFGAIFFVTRQSIHNDDAQRLGTPAASFTLTMNRNGRILDIDSQVDLSQELYEQAARAVLRELGSSPGRRPRRSPRNENLRFGGRVWIYEITYNRNQTSDNQPQPNRRPSSQDAATTVYLVSFVDITMSERTVDRLLGTILLIGAGMLFIIFWISWRYAKRSVAPIEQVWEKQRQFVADASHELKTPLATMMANYDVLIMNQEESIESQGEWMGYMHVGMERMNKLVTSLLTLAKMEDGKLQGKKQGFDFGTLVLKIMQSMEPMAQEKKLCVTEHLGEDLWVYGYEALTGQLFTILYDNALKYAEEAGRVQVELYREKKQVICTIRNTGQGISPEDIPYIFDRFFRTDASRTGGDGGYGLGLPIANSIAQRIGARILVQSQENGWTEFMVRINAEEH